MASIKAVLGMHGELRMRVIRSKPTRRQRLIDWLLALRRF